MRKSYWTRLLVAEQPANSAYHPSLSVCLQADVSQPRDVSDTMGTMTVPAGKMWGAQTQRSLENFRISEDYMPMEVSSSLASF